MPRLVVVLPLAPLEDGDGFPLSAWPLHVTVAPTFEITESIETVVEAIRPAVARSTELPLVAGGNEGFGRALDIPVTIVVPTPELLLLHRELVECLTLLGAAFDDPDFIGDGYRAHITKTRTACMYPGESMTATQAALVDMRPMGDARLRQVVWTAPLGG
jgi:2'-5' RNA ligase